MKDRYTKEYILSLLEKAKEVDSSYQVFAANRHKYKLNPPVSMEEVEKFEKDFNMKFPKDYVYFLTQIGNGGAGPYYGLYSLEELREKEKFFYQDDFLEFVINENCTEEVLVDSKQQRKTGVLIIGTQGCTFDSILICNGSRNGEVVNVQWDMIPDVIPILSNMSFLEWYVKYFELIVEGKSTYAYGWT